jgi:hypothetical protein
MSSAFLVTVAIWKLPAKMWKKILLIMAGVLFLISVVMNQTRSLWLATAGAVPCLLLLFSKRNRLVNIMRFGIVAVLIVLATAWLSQYLLPGFDASEVIAERADTLLTQEAHMGPRERAFKVEMGSWLNGTLIFGRGLSFMQTITNPEDYQRRMAFGHLGYVTYLSQMGLIGLLAYGLYFPLMVLRDGRFLWWHSDLSVIRYMGLLGTASIVSLSIVFAMSSHFLMLGYFPSGALYGSMWSLARSAKKMGTRNNVATSGQQE